MIWHYAVHVLALCRDIAEGSTEYRNHGNPLPPKNCRRNAYLRDTFGVAETAKRLPPYTDCVAFLSPKRHRHAELPTHVLGAARVTLVSSNGSLNPPIYWGLLSVFFIITAVPDRGFSGVKSLPLCYSRAGTCRPKTSSLRYFECDPAGSCSFARDRPLTDAISLNNHVERVLGGVDVVYHVE